MVFRYRRDRDGYIGRQEGEKVLKINRWEKWFYRQIGLIDGLQIHKRQRWLYRQIGGQDGFIGRQEEVLISRYEGEMVILVDMRERWLYWQI